MIDELLPSTVEAAESFTDVLDAPLYPAEEAAVCRAVEKRRREFTTVRYCARRAIARLGHPPVAIIPGARGAPQWPTGIVGSMTHCTGYRAAVVALAPDIVTIGIDAEPHGPLPDGLLEAVSLPGERARLTALNVAAPDRHWDRLLFCVKEAVYKAWFPRTLRGLGFGEADVTLDPGGAFTARLLVAGDTVDGARLTGFHGRWSIDRGLVLATIVVPRADVSGSAGAVSWA